ncbi:MAG: hypothetical protein ACPL3A_10195 [Thermoanaerobacteraceae bacterium]
MINSNRILVDFQFIGNMVSDFKIETRDIKTKEQKGQVTYDFDCNIKEVKELEDGYIRYIEFITNIKAKVKNSILFKINLTMEGAFAGNIQKLKQEDFLGMAGSKWLNDTFSVIAGIYFNCYISFWNKSTSKIAND